MLNEEASGAVKIFRQTSATGTEASLPCEPYSTCHSKAFIVSQNTPMAINVTREIMRRSRRRKVNGLADAQLFRVQPRIGREQRVEVHTGLARDGGVRFAGRDNVRARFGHRR